MKIIIQHNFNTGFGDGLFAMTDYLVNSMNLKRLGFDIKLMFNLNGNLYFKDKTPLDYLDMSHFKVFSEIKVTSSPIVQSEANGFTCVYTHAGAKPSQHYWDMFVDNQSLDFFSENHKMSNYSLVEMINGKIPPYYPILSKEILKMYDTFIEQNSLSDFDSIYFRTQDLDEELDFLERSKEDLNKVLNTDKKIFICSNSKEFKKYIKSLGLNNVCFWEIPLEDEWGGNHLLHQRIDNHNLHLRTVYTLLDMWTLCNSKTINFYTTWGRYSNFLFYAPINNCKIIYK